MQHHMVSHPVPHGSEMDHHSQAGMRPRKMSTTGGNRSWSEEEENYLLQTRMQKMPYKHIAAHLKKTELACRLHYHQLSHGSHRRKRTNSVSSTISSTSAGQSPNCSQYVLPHEQEDYAMGSRHGSPISYGGTSPINRPGVVMASPGRGQHKILLPKPRTLSPPPEPLAGLRINTSDNVIHPQPVDTDRLRAIYESRRAEFWASIAAEYGSNVSAEQLEELWRRGTGIGARPPTPDASPDGSVMSYPMLKPTPFQYSSASAVEPTKSYSPIHMMSAVSVPERIPYTLPTPTPSTLTKNPSWSSTPASSNVPIASLLTEDKHPRGQDVVMRG